MPEHRYLAGDPTAMPPGWRMASNATNDCYLAFICVGFWTLVYICFVQLCKIVSSYRIHREDHIWFRTGSCLMSSTDQMVLLPCDEGESLT